MNHQSYSSVVKHFVWLWWSPTASEALSYGLNLKIFLGGHAPRPSWNAVHYMFTKKKFRALCEPHARTKCARMLAPTPLYVCPPFFNLWIRPWLLCAKNIPKSKIAK